MVVCLSSPFLGEDFWRENVTADVGGSGSAYCSTFKCAKMFAFAPNTFVLPRLGFKLA